DVEQLRLYAVRAESAFVGADARVQCGRRQILVAIFAVRPELQRHGVAFLLQPRSWSIEAERKRRISLDLGRGAVSCPGRGAARSAAPQNRDPLATETWAPDQQRNVFIQEAREGVRVALRCVRGTRALPCLPLTREGGDVGFLRLADRGRRAREARRGRGLGD